MAESGGRTPGTNLSESGNPKSAAQASTPAAKQGRNEGTYTGVKGNVHEMPGIESTDAGTPVDVGSFPRQEMPTPPSISEMLRPTQEARFIESNKYDSAAIKTQYENLANDQTLLKLGSLGGKLQGIIANNMTALWDQAQQRVPGTSGDLTGSVTQELKDAGISDANQAIIQSNLDTLDAIYGKTGTWASADQATIDAAETGAIGAIGQALLDGATGTVNWSLMEKIIPDVDDAVSHIIASGLADTVPIDDKILSTLGYNPEEQRALLDLLGIPEKTSVKEFQKAVDQYVTNVNEPIERALDVLRNPSAAMADRTEALEWLRDQGYTGVMASGATLKAINDDVQAADKVTFNGKETTIDELLSDDSIAGVVSEILDGTADLDELPADLVLLVTQNRDAFNTMLTELQGEVRQYGEVQTERTRVKNGLAQLPDDIRETILTALGYTDDAAYYTTAPDISNLSTFAKTLIDGSEKEQATLNKVIIDLQDVVPPDVIEDLVTGEGIFTTEVIEKLTSDPTYVPIFVEGVRTEAQGDALAARYADDPKSVTAKEVVDTVFGENVFEDLAAIAENLEYTSIYGATRAERDAAKAALRTLGAFDDMDDVGTMVSAMNTLTNYGGIGTGNTQIIAGIKKAITDAKVGFKPGEGIGLIMSGINMDPALGREAADTLRNSAANEYLSYYGLVDSTGKVKWRELEIRLNSLRRQSPAMAEAVFKNTLDKVLPTGFQKLIEKPGQFASASESDRAQVAQTTNALLRLTNTFSPGSAEDKQIEGILKQSLDAVLTSDSGLSWKDKLHAAKPIQYMSTKNLEQIPDAYKDLFEKGSDGLYRIFNASNFNHEMKVNPRLQDLIGAYSNWTAVHGNDVTNFLSGLQAYTKLGGVPYSPGHQTRGKR